jgi:hypothetical protein
MADISLLVDGRSAVDDDICALAQTENAARNKGTTNVFFIMALKQKKEYLSTVRV